GSALLGQLEARARHEGVVTLFLGSDDDYGGTTLFDVDVWPDVLSRAASLRATQRGHALAFYRRHGYAVVGLLPDVNGPGRHDIMMAKRLTWAVGRSPAPPPRRSRRPLHRVARRTARPAAACPSKRQTEPMFPAMPRHAPSDQAPARRWRCRSRRLRCPR